MIDIEPLVDRLPNSRTLAPASAFPPALADTPEPPAGPTIDPRHVALAALLASEQPGLASADLQKRAHTLLSALDLLGGAWLSAEPVADVRSVVDSLRFRDQVVEVLRPLLTGDPEATAWLELIAATSSGEAAMRWLPYDLRIIARLAADAAAASPEGLPQGDAMRLATAARNAALACERSVAWSEGGHEREVRENVQSTWPELLHAIARHVRSGGAAKGKASERALATWSRQKGPPPPEVLVPASRRPVDVVIDGTSPSMFWEGFTDGGAVSGVFVATYGQRREGERIVVHLVIDGGPAHRALGIVRWTRAAASNVEPGLGVELVDASAALEAKIRAFTRRRAPLRVF